MARFHRKKGRKQLDSAQIQRDASRARARGRYRKALSLYEQALTADPKNTSVHRAIAPLLVRAGRHEEAWSHFCVTAEGFVLQGFTEKAIGIYSEATRLLPRQCAAWEAIADLQIDRGHTPEALAVLQAGRRHFRSRRWRPEAIRLLARARSIAPQNFEVGFDLAGLRARTGDRAGALRLLLELLAGASRRQRRQVRTRELRLLRSPAALGRWLGAIFLP